MLDYKYGMSYAEEIARSSDETFYGRRPDNQTALLVYDQGSGLLEGVAADAAFMLAHNAALRQHHEKLYEAQSAGGPDAFAFELERHIKILQPSANLATNATTFRTVSLMDLLLETTAAISGVGELPLDQINARDSVSMRFLLLNYHTVIEAMNQSLAIRQRDFVRAMPRVQLELIIAGSVAFALCVLVATPIFYAAVRDISERT